jgi:chloramphenicol 3-O phosphotransferase
MAPNQQSGFNYQDSAGYLNFLPGQNSRGPTLRAEYGQRSDQLFGLMPEFTKLLANRGNNIILDEVLFDDTHLQSYLKELSQHIVYFIGITCDLKTMQEREILRKDRGIGLSNDLIDRVHSGMREYDLMIDTTLSSPFENANCIFEFIKANPDPQGFVKMRNTLE